MGNVQARFTPFTFHASLLIFETVPGQFLSFLSHPRANFYSPLRGGRLILRPISFQISSDTWLIHRCIMPRHARDVSPSVSSTTLDQIFWKIYWSKRGEEIFYPPIFASPFSQSLVILPNLAKFSAICICVYRHSFFFFFSFFKIILL